MNSLSKFAIGFLLVVPLNWLLPNQAAAAATLQDFDNPGTPYTLTNYSGDLWTIESGGPYGNFLRLCTPTPETHNTIGFDLTATGTEIRFRYAGISVTSDQSLHRALRNSTVLLSCPCWIDTSQIPRRGRKLVSEFKPAWG